LAYYTIGQRKGLGIASSEPLYVLEKNIASNTLVVGKEADLGQNQLEASGVNWIEGKVPEGPLRAQVKIRYKAVEAWASVIPEGDSRVRVEFDQALRDITPGQRVVFYNGETCLGGGTIL
jgi:tRNA-specific 2-thiouridylase